MLPTKENLIKIGNGALIAMAGALCTYVAEVAPTIDFGEFTPIAVAVFSVAINYIRKLITK